MDDDHIKKLLIEAIDLMDYEYKSVLTGYYYNQLSISELAEIKQADQGEIYRILSEARFSLIEYLKNKGVPESEYPQSLSLATELFLSYGEQAIKISETERKEKI